VVLTRSRSQPSQPFLAFVRWGGLLCLVLALLLPVSVRGQETDTLTFGIDAITASKAAPRVTLAGWAADRRLWMLDRRHSYGDQYYDRGVFRHITPLMDREYPIDLATYRFTPGQDQAWREIDTGMRIRTGSITRNQWGISTEIKHVADLGSGHSLGIDAFLREDAQTQRVLLEMAYDWTVASNHHVGVRHTFAQYKPDFDVSAYYQYGDDDSGYVRAEATAMDAYNDFLFGVLGVWKGREEYERVYEQNPYLLQLAVSSPPRYPLRAELFGGWHTPSELVVQSQFNENERYRDREGGHYLGAMVSYRMGPVTTGLMYQRDQSSLDRLGLRSAVTSDYWTEQRYERGGLFATGGWGPFRGSVWLFLVDYYDRQRGTDFSLSTIDQALSWDEERTNYQFRFYYVPEATGLFVGVEYVGLDRRSAPVTGVMGNQWATSWGDRGPSHYRGPVILGYRFGRGAVSMGINYDFDADLKGDRFDNGFFRFTLAW